MWLDTETNEIVIAEDDYALVLSAMEHYKEEVDSTYGMLDDHITEVGIENIDAESMHVRDYLRGEKQKVRKFLDELSKAIDEI